MKLPSAVPASIIGLVAVVAASVGAAAALIALPADPPAALASASPAAVVPVTGREDDDERQVQLTLETGSPRAVVAPRAGVLTASSCASGGMLRGGDVVARIDGAPIIALATSTPLWRDLAPGDAGPDVRALQAELNRLGRSLAVDGVVGASTMRAARGFLGAHDIRLPADAAAVPSDVFAWIPAPAIAIRGCTATVGARVDADTELAQLPSELRGARLEQLPIDPVAGDREVRVGDVVAPIEADGAVTDAAGLARLSGTPEYAIAANAESDAPSVPAQWALRQALTVAVVPPTALWDLRDGVGCIRPARTDGARQQPVAVTVVGSQLGQTFIRPPADRRLRSVVAAPPDAGSCR